MHKLVTCAVLLAMSSILFQYRGKCVVFAPSQIHGWGLYAMQDIAQDEMIIEYVGEVIRPSVADAREQRYEKQGMGSSYLFRIDSEAVSIPLRQ